MTIAVANHTHLLAAWRPALSPTTAMALRSRMERPMLATTRPRSSSGTPHVTARYDRFTERSANCTMHASPPPANSPCEISPVTFHRNANTPCVRDSDGKSGGVGISAGDQRAPVRKARGG